MKTFISFLIILVSLSAYGQFSSSLDCVGAMKIGYRYINPNKSDVPPGFIDIRNNEKADLRADVGINYNIKIGSNLYFRTGLRFANKGYNSRKFDNDHKWGNQSQDGVFNPNIPSGEKEKPNSQFKYHYFFIEIPLVARYEFLHKNKLSFYAEAGGAASYYMKSVTVQKLGSDRKLNKDNDEAINNIQISTLLSAGANYQLNYKTQLFLQPTFNYNLTDLVSAPVNEHLYSAGLELGCRHRIK